MEAGSRIGLSPYFDTSVLKRQSTTQVRCSDEFEIKIWGVADGMWWYDKDYVAGLHPLFLAQTEPITCGVCTHSGLMSE